MADGTGDTAAGGGAAGEAAREGAARWARGDLVGAEASFREALAMSPSSHDLRLALAGVLADSDRFDLALRTLDEAKARARSVPHSADVRVLRLRAEVLRRAGRLDEAREALGRAVEANPREALAWHDLAGALAESGRVDEAVAALTQAVANVPDDPRLHDARGLVAAQAGRYGEAAGHLRHALALARTRPHARADDDAGGPETVQRIAAHLAAVLEMQGDVDGAIAVHRDAQADGPAAPEAAVSHAVTLIKARRFDEAIAVLETTLERFPDAHDAAYYLASAERQAGRLAAAERTFRAASARFPECPSCLFGLAEVLHATGRSGEAALALRHVLAATPDDPDALGLFADACFAVGESDEARDFFRRAIALAPFEVRHVYNLALREREAGRLEEAARLFDRAVDLAPRNDRALYHAAACRADLGRVDEAISLLERFLAAAPAAAAFVRADPNLDGLKLDPRYRERLGASLLDLAGPHRAPARAALASLARDLPEGPGVPGEVATSLPAAGGAPAGRDVRGFLDAVLDALLEHLAAAKAARGSEGPPRHYFETARAGEALLLREADAAARTGPRGRPIAALWREGEEAFAARLAPAR